VKTAFFQVGQTKIELLESTDPGGPIGKFIEKRGEGIHHIAFAAKGLQASLDELKEKGIKLIDEKGRKGAEGLHIAFVHPKETYGVLTELCEKPST
jgi:methylmalonyl-CoA/ethylmalonyl-CoA epimerase